MQHSSHSDMRNDSSPLTADFVDPAFSDDCRSGSFAVRNPMDAIAITAPGRTRCVNAENPTGGKGVAATAASVLGPSRKGSPCIQTVKAGESVTLMDVSGPGVIRHIWMTVTDRTSSTGPNVLRNLILEFYWDGEETPSVQCPIGDFSAAAMHRLVASRLCRWWWLPIAASTAISPCRSNMPVLCCAMTITKTSPHSSIRSITPNMMRFRPMRCASMRNGDVNVLPNLPAIM